MPKGSLPHLKVKCTASDADLAREPRVPPKAPTGIPDAKKDGNRNTGAVRRLYDAFLKASSPKMKAIYFVGQQILKTRSKRSTMFFQIFRFAF